jgi:hypothetical protein
MAKTLTICPGPSICMGVCATCAVSILHRESIRVALLCACGGRFDDRFGWLRPGQCLASPLSGARSRWCSSAVRRSRGQWGPGRRLGRPRRTRVA